MLFHTLIEPIALMFCGHLGRTQLASAALALSVRIHHVQSVHLNHLLKQALVCLSVCEHGLGMA